jgi:hypothetical protein
MEKPNNKESFKIQNKYRQKIRRKRKYNNKFEVIISYHFLNNNNIKMA